MAAVAPAGALSRTRAAADQCSRGVVKSLEAALWAFHAAESFEEAVLRAVNLGDDADTTGAVCGQLAGAYGRIRSAARLGETAWRAVTSYRRCFAASAILITGHMWRRVGPPRQNTTHRESPPDEVPACRPSRDTSDSIELLASPNRLLAGAYPGHRDSTEHLVRIHALVDSASTCS